MLLTAGIVDAKSKRLPDVLTAAAAVLAAGLAVEAGWEALGRGLIAGALAFGVLEIVRRVFERVRGRSGLGFGDVKLMGALAIWLGLLTPWAVVIGSALGLGAFAVLRPKDGRIAFGPALAAGAIIVGLLGEARLWPQPWNPSATPVARQARAAVLEHLEAAGTVDAAAVARAELVSVRTGQPVEQVLNQLGALTDDDLVEAYAEVGACEVWNPDTTPVEADSLALGVTVEFLRRARLLPLSDVKGVLTCAACDPMDDQALSGLVFATGRKVRVLAAKPADWRRAFDRAFARWRRRRCRHRRAPSGTRARSGHRPRGRRRRRSLGRQRV